MKKVTFIFIGILVTLIIVGGFIILSNGGREPSPNNVENAQGEQQEARDEVILVIDYGESEPLIFRVEFIEGMTAFDLLKTKTEELNIPLKTKEFDFGISIEAIGEKENGQDGKYWLYYINEEMPMVSADKSEIKPGDKVEFKFGEPSF